MNNEHIDFHECAKAAEVMRKGARQYRYLVKSVVAEMLDCDPSDVVIRVRKKTYPGSTPEERKDELHE